MKVLVAGANGFIGFNLCLHLLSKGHGLVMTYRDELAPPMARLLKPWHNRIRFIQGDLLDEGLMERLRSCDFDAVANCAVMTNLPGGESSYFLKMARVNLVSQMNLLDLAKAKGVRRFLYVSSSGVYGSLSSVDSLVEENSPLDLEGTYCLTKFTAEGLTERLGAYTDAVAVTGRIAAPYGPFERVTDGRVQMSIMYELARRAMEGKRTLVCHGDVVRDWTYVKDTVEGLYRLLMAEKLRHGVYNVSSSCNTSAADIAATLKAMFPRFEYVLTEEEEGADILLDRAFQRGRLSIARLREDTGFSPAFSLEKGLADYVEMIGRGF